MTITWSVTGASWAQKPVDGLDGVALTADLSVSADGSPAIKFLGIKLGAPNKVGFKSKKTIARADLLAWGLQSFGAENVKKAEADVLSIADQYWLPEK